MGCIYQLTSPSGKSYIGLTVKTAQERWEKHVEHALGKRQNGALYNALRKYGPESFERKTLLIASDLSYLRNTERAAIKSLKTRYPTGYNVSLGGEAYIGPRDDEFRRKVSEAQKLRFSRPDQRELLMKNLSKAQEAHKLKWAGKPRWKKPRRPLTSEQRSLIMKRALARPENKAISIAAARKRALDPIWKANMIAAKTGSKIKPCSENARRNHSEGAKKMWARRKGLL